MPDEISSNWYVFAILSAGAALPQTLTGLHDAPITLVPSGAVAAAVSRIASPSVEASPAHLVRHEATVEAIRRIAPALPVRFGTIFPNAAAVAHSLAERTTILQSDLARIGDKLEMGVSVLLAASASGTAAPHDAQRDGSAADLPEPLRALSGPGARYLASRFAHYASESHAVEDARRLAQRVEAALRPYVVESCYTLRPAPRLALRSAYLLRADQEAGFRRACEDLRASAPDLHVLVTGPWPPYSFVTRPAQSRNEHAAPATLLAGEASLGGNHSVSI